MIRVAAVGDVHVGPDCVGCLDLTEANGAADLLLLAGDLTRLGEPSEAGVLGEELAGVRIPVVAVLGNHDYQADRQGEIAETLAAAGAVVLEGDSCVVDVDGTSVGVAGTKGFGGGFAGACGSDFGEPEMRAFVRHTKNLAGRLEGSLADLRTDVRIALMHYSPVEATLQGERLEIYPFLGSYLLGEAVDRAGADAVFHGHAHRGAHRGSTPGGVKVRNVAKPLIRRPFCVYELPTPLDP